MNETRNNLSVYCAITSAPAGEGSQRTRSYRSATQAHLQEKSSLDVLCSSGLQISAKTSALSLHGRTIAVTQTHTNSVGCTMTMMKTMMRTGKRRKMMEEKNEPPTDLQLLVVSCSSVDDISLEIQLIIHFPRAIYFTVGISKCGGYSSMREEEEESTKEYEPGAYFLHGRTRTSYLPSPNKRYGFHHCGRPHIVPIYMQSHIIYYEERC